MLALPRDSKLELHSTSSLQLVLAPLEIFLKHHWILCLKKMKHFFKIPFALLNQTTMDPSVY